MYCRKCGSEMNEDSRFCNNCGTQNISVTALCPKCGNEVCGSFCSSCGHQMIGSNNIETKNNNEIIFKCLGVLGFILVIIGCCSPFVTARLGFLSQSVNFIDGDGKIVLFLSLIGLIFLLFKFGLVCLVFNLISLITTIIDGINTSNNKIESEYITAGLDYGFYLIIIGLILTMVMCFTISYKKRK